mgnify:CR=1 FL=1
MRGNGFAGGVQKVEMYVKMTWGSSAFLDSKAFSSYGELRIQRVVTILGFSNMVENSGNYSISGTEV